MAKSAPSKRSKGPSLHSRAARRATSPSIDIDKSLKTLNPPPTHSAEQQRPSVLAAHHSAGVSKKTKRKALTAKVRRRQEKGVDRAEEVSERTARRLEKSLGQARVLRSRGKTWDEVNTALTGKGREKKRKGKKGEEEEEHGGEWEDEEVDMGVDDGPGLKAAVPFRMLGEVEAGAEDEDGDEIL